MVFVNDLTNKRWFPGTVDIIGFVADTGCDERNAVFEEWTDGGDDDTGLGDHLVKGVIV